MFRGGLKLSPKDPYLWYMLGVALHEQEQWSGALEAYEKAAVLDPKDVNARKSADAIRRYLQHLDGVKQGGVRDTAAAVLWSHTTESSGSLCVLGGDDLSSPR